MKKSYLLLTLMVLAFISIGYSYAYWSDTLTVSGTADTGDLSVIFTQEQELDKPEYVVSNNDVTPKVFNVVLDKLYPGAIYETSVEVENTGTIPAVLDYIELVNADQNDLSPYVKVSLEFITDPSTPNPVRTVILNEAPLEMLPQLGLSLEVEGQNSTGWINVTVEVLENAPNDITEDEDVNFSIDLYFVQFNRFEELNGSGISDSGNSGSGSGGSDSGLYATIRIPNEDIGAIFSETLEYEGHIYDISSVLGPISSIFTPINYSIEEKEIIIDQDVFVPGEMYYAAAFLSKSGDTPVILQNLQLVSATQNNLSEYIIFNTGLLAAELYTNHIQLSEQPIPRNLFANDLNYNLDFDLFLIIFTVDENIPLPLLDEVTLTIDLEFESQVNNED